MPLERSQNEVGRGLWIVLLPDVGIRHVALVKVFELQGLVSILLEYAQMY